MSMQTDVIIIGAGAAGLSAAKELSKQGISFIVVEASHRIGGRAYSEEIAPDVWFGLIWVVLTWTLDLRLKTILTKATPL
jgi:monoamine oxidase